MRLTWLLALPILANADMLVRVRAYVSAPTGSEVRLSQLCEVTDGTAGALAQLDELVAATSPAKLTTPELITLLKPVVAKARAEGVAVRLNLPALVEVTAGRPLAADAVAADLITLWQSACADCRLEIEGLNLPRVGQVRDWSIKGRPELPRGTFSIPLNLIRDREAPLTAWVSGRLVQHRRVPVARRLIQAGERIAPDDFVFEERDVAQALDGVPAEDDIVGKRARRGLRVGEIMWTGTLERERAVRRGDLVRLHAGENGWDVSLNVTSSQDAFVGDVVSFKNVKTGNVVTGQVTAPGEAEIR